MIADMYRIGLTPEMPNPTRWIQTHPLTYFIYTVSLISPCSCLPVCLSVSRTGGVKLLQGKRHEANCCLSIFSSFRSLIIFSVWTAVRMPLGLLFWDTPCQPWASLSHSTPPPSALFLHQVIGVLISGHLCCQVTDGPVGIKYSICIIGFLAHFIFLPAYVCVSSHVAMHIHMHFYVCVLCRNAFLHVLYSDCFFLFFP